MKLMVTGGAGFFGSLLVEKILAKGMRCSVLDIAKKALIPEGVDYFEADVRDFPSVLRAFEGVDVVHHNVAQVPLAKNKKLFKSVNIDGTRNVLQAALETGVKKVVYTSSSAVYGVPEQNPVLENHVTAPQEAYGEAKLEGEVLCKRFAEKGLDVSIVRPRTIMGHGRLGIFQILFEWIREGYNVPVLGKGENIYQFIHANDLASACILSGEQSGSEIYNCGAAEFGSMRDVLEDLCQYAGTGSKVSSVPMNFAIFGMELSSKLGLSPLGAYHSLMYGRSMYFDSSKAIKHLGWKAQYSNNEMFRQTYDWYLVNREDILAHRYGHSPHRSPLRQGILSLVKRVI